jgi:hypothetical protein
MGDLWRAPWVVSLGRQDTLFLTGVVHLHFWQGRPARICGSPRKCFWSFHDPLPGRRVVGPCWRDTNGSGSLLFLLRDAIGRGKHNTRHGFPVAAKPSRCCGQQFLVLTALSQAASRCAATPRTAMSAVTCKSSVTFRREERRRDDRPCRAFVTERVARSSGASQCRWMDSADGAS